MFFESLDSHFTGLQLGGGGLGGLGTGLGQQTTSQGM